jgi:endo-1,4-beta-xylanase
VDVRGRRRQESKQGRAAETVERAYHCGSEAKQQKQAELYAMYFRLFRKYRKTISSVTFWNISDRHSWLDDFPVRGRKDYPLCLIANCRAGRLMMGL